MKKYKYLFFLNVILLLAFCGNTYSQTVIYPTIEDEKYCVKYKIGGNTFYWTGMWSIGRLDGSYEPGESTEDTYRSAWQYDLSDIGSDATINSAKLFITANNYPTSAEDYKIKVVAFSKNLATSSYETTFKEIINGTVYFENIKYKEAIQKELTSTALKSAVQSALSTGRIAIGVFSQHEGTNNSQADIILNMEITYTPKVHITVINSFGGGNVTVDGISKSSGTTFTWIKGSPHTLLSFDQIYYNQQYVTLNKWTNVNTGQVHNQNPLTLTFNDDNVTYRAEFGAPINVTIQNDFIDGILKVDDEQENSPVSYEWVYNEQHKLEAIDQDYQAPGQPNYFRIFKEWIDPNFHTYPNNPWTYNFTLGGTYTADFSKQFVINIKNDLIEGGSGGDIIVNSSTVTSPHLEYVIEKGDIIVEAIPNQYININGNNIVYNFLNFSDRDVINWGNQMPFPELERTYTPQDHEDIDLLFKAHIHTDSPQNADTKNQRQLLNLGDTWIMVYESNGDIWLTASDDAGITWCKEERMNIRQAHGYNPSISNVFNFGSSYDYYAITWLEENASEEIELHLQTMRAAGDWLFYGWKGGDYYGRVDGVNHRIFDWNGYGDLRSGARPVLRLDLSGTDILMTAAGEVEGSGIHMSHIKFEGNGYNSVEDLDDASVIKYGFNPSPPAGSLGFCRRVSTSTKHKYPVIINTPPSYGGFTKNYIYFAEDNSYLPKLKQHDITANTNSTISIPAEFSGVLSLQGGASPGNATFALSVRTSAYIGGPNVIVFERPSYGGTPQLKTVYRGYDHPTIMVDQQSGFNSSGCVHTVMMQGNDENWYWADGGEIDYLDSEIAGIFSREKVNNNDQEVMIVRDGEVPTIIEKLGGEKKLAKGVLSTTNIRYFRYWDDNKNKFNLSVLDFHGATVQLFDSVKSSNKITAVKLLETGINGFIVRQPDTLLSTIGVKLLRSNNTYMTFAPSNWTMLTTTVLIGVQLNDILLFESMTGTKTLWSFAELSFKGSTFKKDAGDFTEESNDENSKIVSVFPNPFNPITNFTINLKNSGKINLSIYDVRGRLVKNLVNSFKSAGKYTVSFDGHHLSSGIYFYRFQTDNYMKIDKLMLIK